MGLHWTQLSSDVLGLLQGGTVIPAHPLALNAARQLDERRQRALSRYYFDAGEGGLAVGVHSTQFAIRERGLYVPVLKIAMNEAQGWAKRPLVMIAGLSGQTAQARNEAIIARDLGYSAGLLSLAPMANASVDELIVHCSTVAQEIPLIGFYLQRAVGGRDLPATFWRRFASIDNVVAIKIAPFDRYRTIDVVRGVIEANAEERLTLYTGNDDHIVLDLMTPFRLSRNGEDVTVRIKGGLLGHWSVWTRRAVEQFERIRSSINADRPDLDLVALDARVTDSNAAFFDVANGFAGCIAGCHEVLRRQGILEGIWCLDPGEGLSIGQAAEIDRVYSAYPDLNDDEFVRGNLERWLE